MAFAVIDFETTGLVPERGDRIIEVGVVLLNGGGNAEHEWSTLINPRRDIGATHIHGLRAADLVGAPEFGAIADQILDFVIGRTVVAHNATFDMRFLYAELARSGYRICQTPPALCSMKWSGRLVGPAKLQHACEALGIPLANAHSALGDARAAAELFAHLRRGARNHREWADDAHRSLRFTWPTRLGTPAARAVVRGQLHSEPNAWLDKVLSAAWIPGVPEDEASYLLALDSALLDRKISHFEARQLVEAASEAKLSGSTVARLHCRYLRSVAQEAFADGVITDAEHGDLLAVASALGLTNRDVSEAMAWAAAEPIRRAADSFALAEGDRIVFTGEISRPRDEWIASIVAAGLASGGVTRSTKLVVAADPDSLSAKAAKARDYGIPIVDEACFIRLFDDYLARRQRCVSASSHSRTP